MVVDTSTGLVEMTKKAPYSSYVLYCEFCTKKLVITERTIKIIEKSLYMLNLGIFINLKSRRYICKKCCTVIKPTELNHDRNNHSTT